ncbi:MAG: hypothetical protein BMS9Abin20_0185 [Acidimicrobiia bacterium]|nr:MAG: hypothetical protein BMS9Abin20_0185 [Acidimicrobiia bacterium]
MKRENDELRDAFVDAYPRYVAGMLTQRGIPIDAVIADAVVEGTAVLDGLLRALAEIPLVEQRSSPLELFREALRPVDRALALIGAPLPPGGIGARQLAPWDRFGLSPGSSRVLGDAAHEAHLEWSLTKVATLASINDTTAGPAVGLLCSASDRSGLVVQAEAAGYRTVVLPSDESVAVAVVCADEPEADDVIRSVAGAARVIVYGRSIDDIAQVRFASLGARTVLPADRFLERLGDHLPPIV